jgi:hypothetical protein
VRRYRGEVRPFAIVSTLHHARTEEGEAMNYSEEYWSDRLGDDVPEKVKNAIKRIYSAYPPECLPQGLCDPLYIMNVICFELGVGDGRGNFTV